MSCALHPSAYVPSCQLFCHTNEKIILQVRLYHTYKPQQGLSSPYSHFYFNPVVGTKGVWQRGNGRTPPRLCGEFVLVLILVLTNKIHIITEKIAYDLCSFPVGVDLWDFETMSGLALS